MQHNKSWWFLWNIGEKKCSSWYSSIFFGVLSSLYQLAGLQKEMYLFLKSDIMSRMHNSGLIMRFKIDVAITILTVN